MQIIEKRLDEIHPYGPDPAENERNPQAECTAEARQGNHKGKEGAEMKFYRLADWKRKREAILRRDGYMCQKCKRYGKQVPATVVHHIKHADEYPELMYEDSNLISLCAACHDKAHPEKGKKGLRGRY